MKKNYFVTAVNITNRNVKISACSTANRVESGKSSRDFFYQVIINIA